MKTFFNVTVKKLFGQVIKEDGSIEAYDSKKHINQNLMCVDGYAVLIDGKVAKSENGQLEVYPKKNIALKVAEFKKKILAQTQNISKLITVENVVQRFIEEIEKDGGDSSAMQNWLKLITAHGFTTAPLKDAQSVFILLYHPNNLIKLCGLPEGWTGTDSSMKALFRLTWELLNRGC